MRTCLGGVENVKNIVGGEKYMEECVTQLSRTKFCVTNFVSLDQRDEHGCRLCGGWEGRKYGGNISNGMI